MKQIQAYQAKDGRIFASEEDAKRHEMYLDKFIVVDEFLKSSSNQYVATPQKSIARQSIINWEMWKKENAQQ